MEKLTKKEAVRLHRKMWKIISEMSDEEIEGCGMIPNNVLLLALKKMGYDKNNFPYGNLFTCEYVITNGLSCTESNCPINWGGYNCLCEEGYSGFCIYVRTKEYYKIREVAKKISELPEQTDQLEPIIKTQDSVMLNKDDTLYDIQCRYIKYLEEADLVVLVRKPDGSVGESTSYELAFSTYLEKPILEWGTFFNG